MPGTLPGFLGVATFGGIKFVGHSLAASGLKKYEPTIAASAAKIAGARTGFGIVLGPPATLFGGYRTEAVFFRSGYSHFQNVAIYGVLFLARIFIWALVLFLFTRKPPLPKSSLWLYSFLGAVISSLLDWPGYALALAAPGHFVIC